MAIERRKDASARFGKYSAALIISTGAAIFALAASDPRQFREFMTMMPSLPEVFTGQTPRLLVQAQKGLPNEPLPLGVAVVGKSDGTTITIEWLPDGADLSLGTRSDRSGWNLAAADVDNTFIGAPRDFVGVMEPTATLRSASGKPLDRQALRFEWHASKSEELDPTPVDTIVDETDSSRVAAVKSNAPPPLPSAVPLPRSAVPLTRLASTPDIVAPGRETVEAKRGLRLRSTHRQLSSAWVSGASNVLERQGSRPTVNFFRVFSRNHLVGAHPTRVQAQPSGKSQAQDRRVIPANAPTRYSDSRWHDVGYAARKP
jgi:hypothetical protein